MKLRKFSRTKSSRLALIKTLSRSLIVHGKVETTEERGKELVGFVERLFRVRDDQLGERKIAAALSSKKVALLFWKNVLPRFTDRKSGFTKLTRLAKRKGDGATLAKVEWSKPAFEKNKDNTKSVEDRKENKK